MAVDGSVASVQLQQYLFYDGDLTALINGLSEYDPKGEEVAEKYADAQRNIILSSGSTGQQVEYLTMRLVELGYLGGTTGGTVTNSYTSEVVAAVRWFQNSNDLDTDGIAGPKTLTKLYSTDVLTALESQTAKPNTPSEEDGTSYTPTITSVSTADFFSSASQKYFNRSTGVFKDGAYASVTDVATGITYRVRRKGGYNHCDVEPVTAYDTYQMYKIYSYSWSWNRRAVIVILSDGTTLAASINGMPHGTSSISDNTMDGHTCIHFTNSRTHSSDNVDPGHQQAIAEAASANLETLQAKINSQN